MFAERLSTWQWAGVAAVLAGVGVVMLASAAARAGRAPLSRSRAVP